MVRLDAMATETIERPLREVGELSCDAARHPQWVPATLAVLPQRRLGTAGIDRRGG